MEKNDPLKKVWSVLSIPLSVLGLLSLSDQLLTFGEDIQNIIESYKQIVYPIWDGLFFWLWFQMPSWIYDYLTMGLIFTTAHKRVFGFAYAETKLKLIIRNLISLFLSVIFWPFVLHMVIYKIRLYDKDGVVKHDQSDPNAFVYKYNFRDEEVLVIRYILTILLITLVIIILNFTYFSET